MTRSSDDRSTVRIEAEGRTLAEAEIEQTTSPGVVHSDLHVESGPLPRDTRSRLVDAVLDHPDVSAAERLVVTMPLGDSEMLERVRERSEGAEAHAAGATTIVDVRLPHARE